MMTKEEFEEAFRWAEERTRRIHNARMRRLRRAVRGDGIVVAFLVAVVIGFFAFLIWWNVQRPLRERAAYNEGYHGVDLQTAVAMASEGVGRTAEEVLQ